ncbi:phosphate ABC transporter ATP-binding protein [Pseudalkalibacillus sp. SCS-8]|uniref:ABC transporter ATP-binding protein n=1 Tax=Pseudalkalibacillus nanhaiensis TaxID=3115291 RepID=UPI0032DA5F71
MGSNEILIGKDLTTEHLNGISFALLDQQITTVIGPSGAGKSSLLLLLNRLKEPARGEVFYKGKAITQIPVTELRREIGIVFQSSYLFDGTTEENIQYGPKLCGKWEPSETKRLLELVELPQSYISRKVSSLSGGEQQRVALARTLANRPSILLLDEATSALDIRTAEHIEELLFKLRDQEGISIMMVTHNLSQAERMGDQTLFIQKGELLEQGPTKELFQQPKTNELKQFLKE